jgi:anaerobic magnesium-protoporphyrin IX monomethyl ester cyclase
MKSLKGTSTDILIIPHSVQKSLSVSNPIKFSRNGETFDVQSAIRMCYPGSKLSSKKTISWETSKTLNGAVLENLCIQKGYSCLSISDTKENKSILEDAIKSNPAIICISTSFIFSKDSLENLIARIRAHNCQSVIVVGGPFVSISYKILMNKNCEEKNYPEVISTYLFMKDNICANVYVPDASYRGEEKLTDIMDCIIANENYRNIEGIVYYNNGELKSNITDYRSKFKKPFNMNWNLLPDSYFNYKVIPMQTSVGCPYSCTFCNFPKNAKTIAIKEDEDIINEMVAVYKRGIKYVWFVDDNFRLGKKGLPNFLKKLADRNPGVEWMSLFRADTLGEIDLSLLKRSGCREVCLGLESADNQVLTNMNKRETSEVYLDVVPRLLNEGIDCSVYFIIGFPGETFQSVDKTINFISTIEKKQTNATIFWSIFPFQLAPQSPSFSRPFRKRFDLKGSLGKWEHNTMNSDTAFKETMRVFNSIKESGPIYRSDDLEIIDSMNVKDVVDFYSMRQLFAQKASNNEIITQENIISSFSPILKEVSNV